MSNLTSNQETYSQIMSYKSGEPLKIPKYQREYDWDPQMVDLLIQDIMKHYRVYMSANDENKYNYFTGTIVSHQEKTGEPRFIVDGQQRLTTLTVIACALRDIILYARNQTKWDVDGFEISGAKWIPEVDGDSGEEAIDTILSLLRKVIHKTGGTPESSAILELKQTDEARIKWIISDWFEKKEYLCKKTFEWRVGKGAKGLPNYSGGGLPKIYKTYLRTWELFGKKGLGGEEFENFGVIEVKDECFPFDNNTGIWKSDGSDDKYKQQEWELVSNKEEMKKAIHKISQFSHSFRELCDVIVVKCKDSWQAHVIFDRANSAGKKLAMIDIIRAKLFAELDKTGAT